MDRQCGVKSPGGTITRMVYDVRGLVVETHISTNDDGFPGGDNFVTAGTSTVETVRVNEYDGGTDGGNGLLTEATAKLGAGDRVTSYAYDWRNRLKTTTGELQYFHENFYNLDRVIKIEQKDGSAGDRIAQSESFYDDRGRAQPHFSAAM